MASFLIAMLLVSCKQSIKRQIGDLGDLDFEPGSKSIQRVGTEEVIEVIQVPNRADIIFMFDTSPSMQALWTGNDAIRRGMDAWLTMMFNTATAHGGQDRFDFFMFVTTPNMTPGIIGANGNYAAWENTQNQVFKSNILSGINAVARYTYPPGTSVYDALIASMNTYPHRRRTAPLEIVYFGDTLGSDDSTRSINDLFDRLFGNQNLGIDPFIYYSTVNIRLLIATPHAGKTYNTASELAQDVTPGSSADLLLELRNYTNVEVYVLDRTGYTAQNDPFEQTFLEIGRDTSTPPNMFALRTNVTNDILKVFINDYEVSRNTYRYVIDSRGVYYLEFIAPPAPGAPGPYPPPGSTLKIQYQ